MASTAESPRDSLPFFITPEKATGAAKSRPDRIHSLCAEIHRLQALFRHPYDDEEEEEDDDDDDDTENDEDGGGMPWGQASKPRGADYFRAAPPELETQGGIGFMS